MSPRPKSVHVAVMNLGAKGPNYYLRSVGNATRGYVVAGGLLVTRRVTGVDLPCDRLLV